MKAELANGEIVTLEKDCNCVTHNDPHWTYMDRVSRNLNRRIAYEADGTLKRDFFALYGFAIEEQARCDQKIRDMQRRGIVRLIHEESDEMTDIQRVQLEHNRLACLADLERKLPAPIKSEEELRRERIDRRDEVREKAKATI
jgi:hypothetical protein